MSVSILPSDLTDEANIAIAAPNTIIDVAVLIKPLPEPSISFAAADIVTIKPAILTKPLTISPQLRLDKDFIDADNNNIAIDIPTMAVAIPVIFPKPLVISIFSKSTIAPINSANNAVIPVKEVFNPASSIVDRVANENANIPTAAAIFNRVPAFMFCDHAVNESPTESNISDTESPTFLIESKKLVESSTVDFNVSKLPFIVLNIPPVIKAVRAPNIAPKSIVPNALPTPSSIGAIPFPIPCIALPKVLNTLLKSSLLK